jgi:fluoroacetyl-CoA thioesterase
MKPSLAVGLETKRTLRIDEGRTIGFMGEEGRVYATPSLLEDIEHTCHDLLQDHLDDGEDSVGTKVELEHLAATPLGFTVEITARITAIDRRAVTFAATVHDGIDEACRCTHGRFVVDVAKTQERLAAKAAQAGN